jgi:predicted metal-dependent hydrolase
VIDYALKRTKRKTLAISVLPNGRVEVVAPLRAAADVIDLRVRRRKRWIMKQRRFFEQFEPRLTTRHYVPNETHLYLGRQYRLVLRQGGSDTVTTNGAQLVVTTRRHANTRKTKALLDAWYVARAHARFESRLDALFGPFARRGLAKPKLAVRALKKRWGSVSGAGTLTLNRALVQAPLPCIDYVVVHELCHLVHADHGPKFFALLSRLMPDWQKRKQRLERTLASV